MMLVKTKIGPSSIHGIGLFADQDIPKGTRVWEFTPGFDLEIPQDRIDNVPSAAREHFIKYSYLSRKNGQYYILCSDDARFFNHSNSPNVVSAFSNNGEEDPDVAAYDIKKGEELTCDYRSFEAAEMPYLMNGDN